MDNSAVSSGLRTREPEKGMRFKARLRLDPNGVRKLSASLRSISSFSLLQIVPWTWHRLPTHIVAALEEAREGVGKLWTCRVGCSVGCVVRLGAVLGLVCLLPFVGLGFLSFTVKMEQVQFVGEIETRNWSRLQQLQFLAFLNNVVNLDISKSESLKTCLTFLFGGTDGTEQKSEKFTEHTFMNMITAHVMHKSGLWGALVVVTQIGPKDIQQLCIKEIAESEETAEAGGAESFAEAELQQFMPEIQALLVKAGAESFAEAELLVKSFDNMLSKCQRTQPCAPPRAQTIA